MTTQLILNSLLPGQRWSSSSEKKKEYSHNPGSLEKIFSSKSPSKHNSPYRRNLGEIPKRSALSLKPRRESEFSLSEDPKENKKTLIEIDREKDVLAEAFDKNKKDLFSYGIPLESPKTSVSNEMKNYHSSFRLNAFDDWMECSYAISDVLFCTSCMPCSKPNNKEELFVYVAFYSFISVSLVGAMACIVAACVGTAPVWLGMSAPLIVVIVGMILSMGRPVTLLLLVSSFLCYSLIKYIIKAAFYAVSRIFCRLFESLYACKDLFCSYKKEQTYSVELAEKQDMSSLFAELVEKQNRLALECLALDFRRFCCARDRYSMREFWKTLQKTFLVKPFYSAFGRSFFYEWTNSGLFSRLYSNKTLFSQESFAQYIAEVFCTLLEKNPDSETEEHLVSLVKNITIPELNSLQGCIIFNDIKGMKGRKDIMISEEMLAEEIKRTPLKALWVTVIYSLFERGQSALAKRFLESLEVDERIAIFCDSQHWDSRLQKRVDFIKKVLELGDEFKFMLNGESRLELPKVLGELIEKYSYGM